MTAHLRAVEGPAAGATWELPPRELSLGRASGGDIVVPDPSISRHHCNVRPSGDSFVVEDAGSRHGLVIGGERRPRHVLHDGDVFVLGDSVFRFSASGAPLADVTLHLSEDGVSVVDAERVADVPALMTPRHAAGALSSLRAIRDAALEMAAAHDLATAAATLVARAGMAAGADRASVTFVRRDATGEVELGPAFGWTAPSRSAAPMLLSRTLARRVLDDGIAVLVHEVGLDPNLRGSASLDEAQARSLAAAPLMLGDSALGLLSVDSSTPGALGEAALDVVTALAAISAAPLELLRRGDAGETEEPNRLPRSGGALLVLRAGAPLDAWGALQLRQAMARARGVPWSVLVVDPQPWGAAVPRPVLERLAALEVPVDAALAVTSAVPSLARLATLAATLQPGEIGGDVSAWLQRLLVAGGVVAAKAAFVATDDAPGLSQGGDTVTAARRVAQRISKVAPGTCPQPMHLLPELGELPSLDGNGLMGTTEKGSLLLGDDDAAIRRKIRTSKTDAAAALDPSAEMSASVRSLLLLLSELSGERVDRQLQRLAGSGYGALKDALAEAAAAWLGDVRQRTARLASESSLRGAFTAGSEALERSAREAADAFARATRS